MISVTGHSREDGMVAGMDPVTVEFEASRAWKGSDHETMYLTTARDDGACGIGFREGDQYVVYSLNGVTVDICTRTVRCPRPHTTSGNWGREVLRRRERLPQRPSFPTTPRPALYRLTLPLNPMPTHLLPSQLPRRQLDAMWLRRHATCG